MPVNAPSSLKKPRRSLCSVLSNVALVFFLGFGSATYLYADLAGRATEPASYILAGATVGSLALVWAFTKLDEIFEARREPGSFS